MNTMSLSSPLLPLPPLMQCAAVDQQVLAGAGDDAGGAEVVAGRAVLEQRADPQP
jgi:hypothetical protein